MNFFFPPGLEDKCNKVSHSLIIPCGVVVELQFAVSPKLIAAGCPQGYLRIANFSLLYPAKASHLSY